MSIAISCTKNAFQFAIEGHIAPCEGAQALVCSDGTHLRVIPQLQEYPSGQMLWHLLPSTESTGVISSVKVVEIQSPTAIGKLHQDQCQVVGRVIQISKRQNLILFKVNRQS